MKLFGKTGTLLASCLIVLAGAGCIGIYTMYENETRKNEELQAQIAELSKKENESAIMQSINAQMEEIALQERQISDEQRVAAEQQTRVAEEMRRHAEEEQQKAIYAQHQAQAAEEVANSQRLIAENQRSQAELQKHIADTLGYRTLARQLGNVAITQHQAGNTELAELLTYASYLFTKRYQGDIYYPTIYQALVMTSQSRHQWNKHKGAVMDIAFMEGGHYEFVTCSSYGQLYSHRQTGYKLETDTIFSNKDYDFRDVFIDHKRKTLYAVSRRGQLLTRENGEIQIQIIDGIGPLMAIEPIGKADNSSDMIVIGERGLVLLDNRSHKPVKTKTFSYTVKTVSRYDNAPILFDDKGYMHTIYGTENIKTERVPVAGQVTAFASSKGTGIKTFGMLDGTIYYFDAKGKSHKLVGHRSRVSKIKINGWRIYSSSLDGTLNLWMADNAKIEPMTIIHTNGWLIQFTFDKLKYNIWCGDQRGTLTEAFISVPMMTMRLKNKLTRNLTREEWNYYIGNNVPYETFIRKGGSQ